jgi:hypothetical protein
MPTCCSGTHNFLELPVKGKQQPERMERELFSSWLFQYDWLLQASVSSSVNLGHKQLLTMAIICSKLNNT